MAPPNVLAAKFPWASCSREELIDFAATKLVSISRERLQPQNAKELLDYGHTVIMAFLTLILVALDHNRGESAAFDPTLGISQNAIEVFTIQFVEPAFWKWFETAESRFMESYPIEHKFDKVDWWKWCISELDENLRGFTSLAAIS